MEEIKLTNKNQPEVLKRAVEVLKKGGVIVYPTETSYGLGCDFYNPKALRKIYKIKGRSFKKLLPIIVADYKTASSLVKMSQLAKQLAEKYWPGPLTLILPIKKSIKQNKENGYLALRISSHQLATKITNFFGEPLVSTSANISGKDNIYHPYKIRREFKNSKFKPDLFINVGQLSVYPPSTIVKVSGQKLEILRQGKIKISKKFISQK